MKRTLLSIIALFFPWIAFLILGKPVPALMALALQLTFVGWLPATIWAWRDIRRTESLKPEPKAQATQTTTIDKTEHINQDLVEKQADTAPVPSSSEPKDGVNPPPSSP